MWPADEEPSEASFGVALRDTRKAITECSSTLDKWEGRRVAQGFSLKTAWFGTEAPYESNTPVKVER